MATPPSSESPPPTGLGLWASCRDLREKRGQRTQRTDWRGARGEPSARPSPAPAPPPPSNARPAPPPSPRPEPQSQLESGASAAGVRLPRAEGCRQRSPPVSAAPAPEPRYTLRGSNRLSAACTLALGRSTRTAPQPPCHPLLHTPPVHSWSSPPAARGPSPPLSSAPLSVFLAPHLPSLATLDLESGPGPSALHGDLPASLRWAPQWGRPGWSVQLEAVAGVGGGE